MDRPPRLNPAAMKFFLVLLLAALPLAAAQRTIMRNASGRVVGISETDDNRTTFRNASGEIVGTAETNGTRTTYRNANGQTTGTADASNGRIIYRDASGRFAGTADTTGFTYFYGIATITAIAAHGIDNSIGDGDVAADTGSTGTARFTPTAHFGAKTAANTTITSSGIDSGTIDDDITADAGSAIKAVLILSTILAILASGN